VRSWLDVFGCWCNVLQVVLSALVLLVQVFIDLWLLAVINNIFFFVLPLASSLRLCVFFFGIL
jgi:hypothetical protein